MMFQDDEEIDYDELWQGMPEYQEEGDKIVYKSLIVNFVNEDDIIRFSNLVDQKITKKTKSIWYPEQERIDNKRFAIVDEKVNES